MGWRPDRSGRNASSCRRWSASEEEDRAIPRLSLVPKDRVFFDLFEEAASNILRSAELLETMLADYPERSDLARELLICEQEGDRITHDIIHRLNETFVTPIDREDIYALASALDDIVDFIEEVGDYMGLYKIEAPMDKAQELTKVVVQAARQIAEAMPRLRGFRDLSHFTVELHRIENEGDRLTREALATLFGQEGIDPMVVIRWKDIYDRLEAAIDATEKVALIVESIVIKNA
jgi:predicted phosphate transport protein (TIGR00153 family)